MSQAGYDAMIFDAETINSTTEATVYSKPFSMRKGSLFSLHYSWTGTPTSTITFWQSNKADPDQSSDTDWVQNTDLTFTNPAGSASKAFNGAGNSAARWYRMKVVTSGGSGTFSCWMFGGKSA